MIYRRYNELKRTEIILCMPDIESVELFGVHSEHHLRTILENAYKSKILDQAPYHYALFDDNIVELKSPDIAHNDEGAMKAFNDDVRILLCDKDIVFKKKDEIADIISSISLKYGLLIGDNIQLIGFALPSNTDDSIDYIKKRAINIRNERMPLLNVCESVIDGVIISNKDIIFRSNRDGFNTLSLIGNKYCLPIETLIAINPHIDPDNVKITDTIFLPATIALTAFFNAERCQKRARYLFSIGEQAILRGVGVSG